MDIATLKPSMTYKDKSGYDFGAISNDKKFIAFQKSGNSSADSDIYLYEVERKMMREVTPHEGEISNSPKN